MSRPGGIEVNTFTLLARCPRTGQLGVAITTRTIAVGQRCTYIAAPHGIVVAQATVNPTLGLLGANLLEQRHPAPRVLDEMAASDEHIEYRQLAVIDGDGRAVARTGKDNRAWAGHLVGDGWVAMGNVLLGEHVVDAMGRAFTATAAAPFDERLLRAIEAGRDAGGQHGGQRSAGLLIHDVRGGVPVLDLRVDEHREPVGELRRIHGLFRPLLPYYEQMRLNPVGLPPYDRWLEQQTTNR
jgi:uncharacterized Ntn-hydrolase superfamily protein